MANATVAGPIRESRINQTLYVGEAGIRNIQAAVNYARADGGIFVVIIPHSYAGSDTVAAIVNGSSSVIVSDERGSNGQTYVWGAGAYGPANFEQLGSITAYGPNNIDITRSSVSIGTGINHTHPNINLVDASADVDEHAWVMATFPDAGQGPLLSFAVEDDQGFANYWMAVWRNGATPTKIQIVPPLTLAGTLHAGDANFADIGVTGTVGIGGHLTGVSATFSGDLAALTAEITAHMTAGSADIGGALTAGSGAIANNLSVGGNLSAASGAFDVGTVDGSPIRTFANTPDGGGGDGMEWPPAGVPQSTGTAWGASIAANTLVRTNPGAVQTINNVLYANSFGVSGKDGGLATNMAHLEWDTNNQNAIVRAFGVSGGGVQLVGSIDRGPVTTFLDCQNNAITFPNIPLVMKDVNGTELQIDLLQNLGRSRFIAASPTAALGQFEFSAGSSGDFQTYMVMDGASVQIDRALIVTDPAAGTTGALFVAPNLPSGSSNSIFVGQTNTANNAVAFGMHYNPGAGNRGFISFAGGAEIASWDAAGMVTVGNITVGNEVIANGSVQTGYFSLSTGLTIQGDGGSSFIDGAPNGRLLINQKSGPGSVCHVTGQLSATDQFSCLAGTSESWFVVQGTVALTQPGASLGIGFDTRTAYFNSLGNDTGTRGGFIFRAAMQDGGSMIQVLTIDGAGNAHVTGDISAGSKSFRIPHPLNKKKNLTHGCVEGPEHAVYYRGEATTTKGIATVTLPAYFEALTEQDGRTVQLTQVVEEGKLFSMVAASRIVKGKFKIHAINSAAEESTVCWEVKAIRKGVTIEVESDREAA